MKSGNREIWNELLSMETVDGHAHPWSASPVNANGPDIRWGLRHDLSHTALMREWKSLLEFCNSDGRDYNVGEVARKIGLSEILIDTGWPLNKSGKRDMFPSEFIPFHRLARIEDAWAVALEGRKSLNAVMDGLSQALVELKRKTVRFAGWKSVVAYSTGLDICHRSPRNIADALRLFAARPNQRIPKELADWLFLMTIKEISRMGDVLQLHTGFGVSMSCQSKTDPSNLIPILADDAGSLKVVLLHSGWPFTRQAGWMARMFQHVYVDLSMMPLYHPLEYTDILRELWYISPHDKLIYGSDAFTTQENYVLALWQAKSSLCELGAELLQFGLDKEEIETGFRSFLSNNCRKLYNLHIGNGD